jgi:hypothetical protein
MAEGGEEGRRKSEFSVYIASPRTFSMNDQPSVPASHSPSIFDQLLLDRRLKDAYVIERVCSATCYDLQGFG